MGNDIVSALVYCALELRAGTLARVILLSSEARDLNPLPPSKNEYK